MANVLIHWWWGKRESGLPTLQFQLVWGLCACGKGTVNFSYLVGVSISARQLKVCITWGRIRTLPQSCAIVSWLLLPSLHIPSLPWLVIVWTDLWSSGKVMEAEWSLFPTINQGRRLLCPGAPQNYFQFHMFHHCHPYNTWWASFSCCIAVR